MKTKLDFYRLDCNSCSNHAIIYVREGHNPIQQEELGGMKLYPSRSEDGYEFHLCPECQRKEPKLRVIKND